VTAAPARHEIRGERRQREHDEDEHQQSESMVGRSESPATRMVSSVHCDH
jgi:hypothetical protein